MRWLVRDTVASDPGLWVNSFNGTATYIGNPGCTSIGGGHVLCAAVGVNGNGPSTIGPNLV